MRRFSVRIRCGTRFVPHCYINVRSIQIVFGDQFFEAGFELRGSGNEGQPQRVADESQYRHGAFHARRVAFGEEGGHGLLQTFVSLVCSFEVALLCQVDASHHLAREGIDRYRISSIEPNLLTDEIIEFVSRSRRFMPHFHIPLQSGCDEVLKLMRRRYDTALFASKIKKIKEVMPDAFIGVDVIVGTRGETEAYFEQAYQFISGLDVTQLHVFSYSERPGTQALKIDYVVSPEEKHQRSQRLLALSDEKTQAFYARHIGQTMEVLMEKSKAGTPMHGFTANYIRVEVENDESLDNQMINVRLGEFNEEMTALKGTILMNDEV